MVHIVEELEFVDPVTGLTADGNGRVGLTVIGIDPRDHMSFLGLAAYCLVELGDAVGKVVGGRPAGTEEHMVEIARGEFGEFGGQIGSRNVGHVHERIRVGQPADLIGNGFHHVFTTQTNVCAPQSADCIDVSLAVGVGDVGPSARSDREGALLGEGVEHLIGMNVMAFVAFDYGRGFGAHVVGHVRFLSLQVGVLQNPGICFGK